LNKIIDKHYILGTKIVKLNKMCLITNNFIM